jgi:hypothetical protein
MALHRLLVGLLTLIALAGFSQTGKAADGTCSSRATILSLSDIVLTDRAHLPPLIARRYGAEAAFLKIRYTPLSDTETRRLLQTLLVSNVRAADDLAYAWYIMKDGYTATIATQGAERFDLLVSAAGTSTIRAMSLGTSDTDNLMKRIAAAKNTLMSNVSTAILDQPDEIKERVAFAAEAQNLPAIAAYIVATEKNTQAWDAFLKREAGRTNPQMLSHLVYSLPALVGNAFLNRQDVPDRVKDEKVNRIMKTVALVPESDFLLTFLNQTGYLDQVDIVASILRAQIESGAIRRNGTLDDAWLTVYRNLTVLIGRSQVDAMLGITAYSGRRYVRLPGVFMVRDAIDWLLAVDTWRPYVTGRSSNLPPAPVELSDKMKADWTRWSEMAAVVHAGAIPSGLASDPISFGIISELLLAKGDLIALKDFIELAPVGEARALVANDFAMRLDRACASYLAHPAEAILLPGQPIFKFDMTP